MAFLYNHASNLIVHSRQLQMGKVRHPSPLSGLERQRDGSGHVRVKGMARYSSFEDASKWLQSIGGGLVGPRPKAADYDEVIASYRDLSRSCLVPVGASD